MKKTLSMYAIIWIIVSFTLLTPVRTHAFGLGNFVLGGTVEKVWPVFLTWPGCVGLVPLPPPPPVLCTDWIVTIRGVFGQTHLLLIGPGKPPVFGQLHPGAAVLGFGVPLGPYFLSAGLVASSI